MRCLEVGKSQQFFGCDIQETVVLTRRTLNLVGIDTLDEHSSPLPIVVMPIGWLPIASGATYSADRGGGRHRGHP